MATSVSSLEGSTGRDENFERLFKTFTFKSLQVIIQSRVERKPLRSNKESNDIFSVSIPDNPAIEEQLKKSLADVKSFPPKGPICVEVALVTSEGDHMFLETWDLTFSLSSLDMSANRIQHIYTRMGVTLKSLLCASRALPAYRLARNQGEKGGGYRLTHRVYLDKPQTHLLGEGHSTMRAGSVPTAHGLLTVGVSYRTKLLLSPDMSASATTAIEVTDNYFVKESKRVKAQGSPGTSNPLPCSPPRNSSRGGAESPYCFAVSPSSLEKEDQAMIAKAETEAERLVDSGAVRIDELPEPIIGAFTHPASVDHFAAEPEVPFEGLMRRSVLCRPSPTEEDKLSDEEEKENLPTSASSRQTLAALCGNLDDEFVMVDKPPFADEDDPTDVKAFLGSMMRAPNLYVSEGSGSEGGSPAVVTVKEYLSGVEELVTRLEGEMPVFDDFCNSVINMTSTEEEEEEDHAEMSLVS